MIGYCGFCCETCPAFHENSLTDEDRLRTAEAWSRYFDVAVPPETVWCRGCDSQDREGWDSPDHLCGIRPCVLDHGVDTCASCPEYPCAKLKARMAAFDRVAKCWRPVLSREDYEKFIRPYDARENREEIRHRVPSRLTM